MSASFTPLSEEEYSSVKGMLSGGVSDDDWDNFFELLEKHEEQSIDAEKAWGMIHACLNEGKSEPLRVTTASMAIAGFETLNEEDAFFAGIPKSELAPIIDAIGAYDVAALKNTIPTLDAEKVYGVTGQNDDIEYAVENFRPLKSFYETCLKNNQAVVIEIG